MSFDKFEARCKLGAKSAYAMLSYYWRHHYERRKARLMAIPENKRLICQECRGRGGEIEPITDEGYGPWYDCEFCQGVGYVLPYERGQWLRWRKSEKHAA